MISISQRCRADLLLTPWGRVDFKPRLCCSSQNPACMEETALMALAFLQHPSSLPKEQPGISVPRQPGEAPSDERRDGEPA